MANTDLSTWFIAQAGFASGGMLLWGLAAAIPIAIHLWNRRQQHELPWAAMQFLLAAMQRHARRKRFEQWLLLVLRVCILLLLAIALADPQLLATAFSPAIAQERTHTILVLDGSYSMAARWDGQSNFERARQRALAELRGGRQGDGYSLLLMSAVPREVVGDVVFDPADVADEIDALEFEHTVARLQPALELLQDAIQRSAERHRRLTRRRIVFFTDLGQNTWREVETESVRQRLAALSEFARLELIEIGRQPESNRVVSDLRTPTNLIMAGDTVSLEVTLRQWGIPPQPGRLSLLVDGRSLHERAVSTDAGGETIHTFEHRFRAPGTYLIEARLSADALDVDNRRWLCLSVPGTLPVLCVEGRPGAAKHLALSLAPGEQGRISPQVVGESALLEMELEKFACVCLSNVGRLRVPEAQRLREYVRGGGGLIVLLGDRVQRESYNQAASPTDETQALFPALLGQIESNGAHRFDPLGYAHPVTVPFRGNERAGLLTVPTWRYFRLELGDESVETILRFENGDPALVAHQLGEGHCLLLATAASPTALDRSVTPSVPWSALASWPSFPPLMHEMLKYAIRGEQTRRNLLVGEVFAGEWAVAAPDSRVTVVDPRGHESAVAAEFDRRPPRVRYADTWISGVYRIMLDSGAEESLADATAARSLPATEDETRQAVAVNVDPQEGLLNRIDVSLLPSQLSPPEPVLQQQEPVVLYGPQPVYRLCLFVLLTCVLLETALGRWLGRKGG